jgi:DNA-binding NarL/FixJ family response regulator
LWKETFDFLRLVENQGFEYPLNCKTRADPQVIAEADSSIAAIAAVKQQQPDVILMDLEMPGELAAAIRKAANGETVLDSRVALRIVLGLQGIRRDEVNPFTELSEREFDVLRLIAAGKSNAEIAELLAIGESTVKTHISNLLKKLHLDDRTQAAVYAWKEGIVRRNK